MAFNTKALLIKTSSIVIILQLLHFNHLYLPSLKLFSLSHQEKKTIKEYYLDPIKCKSNRLMWIRIEISNLKKNENGRYFTKNYILQDSCIISLIRRKRLTNQTMFMLFFFWFMKHHSGNVNNLFPFIGNIHSNQMDAQR